MPDTRRRDKAASVPCAPQRTGAGPNSHIHVLKHAGLAPPFASGARLTLRREDQEQKQQRAPARGPNEARKLEVTVEIELTPRETTAHDKTYPPNAGHICSWACHSWRNIEGLRRKLALRSINLPLGRATFGIASEGHIKSSSRYRGTRYRPNSKTSGHLYFLRSLGMAHGAAPMARSTRLRSFIRFLEFTGSASV